MRVYDKYIKKAEEQAINTNNMELLQKILDLVIKYKVIY